MVVPIPTLLELAMEKNSLVLSELKRKPMRPSAVLVRMSQVEVAEPERLSKISVAPVESVEAIPMFAAAPET